MSPTDKPWFVTVLYFVARHWERAMENTKDGVIWILEQMRVVSK